MADFDRMPYNLIQKNETYYNGLKDVFESYFVRKPNTSSNYIKGQIDQFTRNILRNEPHPRANSLSRKSSVDLSWVDQNHSFTAQDQRTGVISDHRLDVQNMQNRFNKIFRSQEKMKRIVQYQTRVAKETMDKGSHRKHLSYSENQLLGYMNELDHKQFPNLFRERLSRQRQRQRVEELATKKYALVWTQTYIPPTNRSHSQTPRRSLTRSSDVLPLERQIMEAVL